MKENFYYLIKVDHLIIFNTFYTCTILSLCYHPVLKGRKKNTLRLVINNDTS